MGKWPASSAAATADKLYQSGIFLIPPSDFGFAANVMAANALYAFPLRIFGSLPVNFASIAVSVTAAIAASVIRLGAYAFGPTGPGALLYDLGTIDSSSVGTKTLATPFTLPAGMVWLAAVAQGGAPSVRSNNSNGGGSSIDGLSTVSTSGLAVSPDATRIAAATPAGALPDPFGAHATTAIPFPRYELLVA